MLTRLETMVNQEHQVWLPASLTRLRSLSLNCCAGNHPAAAATFLQASVGSMPACLTTLRLALWSTHMQADLSPLTQLKVTPVFWHPISRSRSALPSMRLGPST